MEAEAQYIQNSLSSLENSFQPVTDLTKIFPDIQNELCSRHSTLLGKLKTTFNKLYDKMQPTYYVIVKGNTHIIGTQNDEVGLSMGLENGIIILVSKTFEQANIFINGNHMDEQLILSCNGKIQEGLYQRSQEFQTIYQTTTAKISPDKLYGGIIYIHANIPQGFYHYKNSLLTAFYLSALLINSQLHKYETSQLILQIIQTKLIDQFFLQKSFYDYENRHFSLKVGSTMYKVPLDKNIKLLFCRMDLANCDVRHSQSNIKQIKEDKDKIIEWMKKNYGIKSFYEAFEQQLQVNIQNLCIDGVNNEEKLQYLKLIQSELKELRILCQYSNNHISVQDLIVMKWFIDSQVREIFNSEVIQLVESIKQKTKINACTIVEGQFIMIAVDKNKYADLICSLRSLLNRGELKSKSFVKLEEELIENRWSEDNEIGEKIFVSVPSKGVAIFDPSESIWFD